MRTDDTKDDAPATIRHLTHRTSGGDVYTRPEAVERHIAEALALTSLDLAMRVQIRDADADGYLCDECLVYLLQEYQRGRSVERINSVAAELLWRSSRLIHTRLSSLGQMAEDAYAVTGTVQQVNGTTLTLAARGGATTTVTTAGNTKVTARRQGAFADLKVGDQVTTSAASGSGTGGAAFTAATVVDQTAH